MTLRKALRSPFLVLGVFNLIGCVGLTWIAVGTRDPYIGAVATLFGVLLIYTYWRTCRASLS
jgi:hypothetical protein